MNNKRLFWIITLVLAGALALAACGPAAQPETGAADTAAVEEPASQEAATSEEADHHEEEAAAEEADHHEEEAAAEEAEHHEEEAAVEEADHHEEEAAAEEAEHHEEEAAVEVADHHEEEAMMDDGMMDDGMMEDADHHEEGGDAHSPDDHMAGAHGVPDEAAAVPNPVEATDASVAAGSELYAANCAVCHGETGAGDGLAAANLDPKPANLSADHVQELSDGALFYIITHGRPNTPMPAWEGVLTEEQRWQVVNFLRTFGE